MLEKNIDIFSKEVLTNVNAICFTSNGIVKKNECLVMGAGVAKVFKDAFYGIDKKSGKLVKEHGNVCQIVLEEFINIENISYPICVISFPTKNHFKDKSDIDLIIRSARRLMEIVEEKKWKLIALPRPGIGLGSLDWSIVRGELEKVFDNRVVVVYR